MSLCSKNSVLILAACWFGAMNVAVPAVADQTFSASGVLDRLETQVEGLKSRLNLAQGYGYRPAGRVGGADEDPQFNAPAEDAAGTEVRIGHLEEEIRQINGRLEQAEFAQHKLEEQLKKFQQDVDFRFQDAARGGAARPQKRGDLPEGDGATGMATSQSAAVSPGSPTPSRGRRGDAFDPAADPEAPGAPRQLGSIASSATALPPPQTPKPSTAAVTPVIAADPDAPLDLAPAPRSSAMATPNPAATPPAGFGTAAAPRQIPLTPQTPAPQPPALETVASPATQLASLPSIATPKEEFDSALISLRQKEYETAERGFSAFLQKNPKNRMAPDAIYYLGESYFQRGRQREAAEQYLKISTDYAASYRAPEAMLRLGQSLNALGAKEQACATFGEVTRKYPNASGWVKSGAEREAKKAQC
jgi:tol-pal system protein YbgF